MSDSYIGADAHDALFQALGRAEAAASWHTDMVSASHALGLFNVGGDGLIVQGTPEQILWYVDLLHAHAHSVLDGAQ
ncbi:hypothetical protein A5658_04745 [Mycobacterium sp. 1245111.1]|uniref:hypothetical protein n=1 Tax=Mycobacterium sp. 1245111.1 TaxID=1834073 RepID=UPI000800FE96|nr:hypothetical protein [Mycobacterium sp. 1245111.1]OBK36972.1 hypothetical protein A5658_04745 [Mycobacterium sp. 1245111.1]